MSELLDCLTSWEVYFKANRKWRLWGNVKTMKMFAKRKSYRMVRIYCRTMPANAKNDILSKMFASNVVHRTSRLEKEIDRRTNEIIKNCKRSDLAGAGNPNTNPKYLLWLNQIEDYWTKYYNGNAAKGNAKRNEILNKLKKD